MNKLNEGDCEVAKCSSLHRSLRRPDRWQKILSIAGILLIGSLSGCASVSGVFSSCDCSLNTSLHMTRAQLMARRVWSQKHRDCYAKHCNTAAVRRGFIDGFVDVASGKDGCPPVFPPQSQCCLVGSFRSPICDNRNQAWFEGYPLGAAAAEQQGCHLWWRTTLPAHLTAQYQPVANTATVGTGCGPNISVYETEQVPMEAFGLSDREMQYIPNGDAVSDHHDLVESSVEILVPTSVRIAPDSRRVNNGPNFAEPLAVPPLPNKTPGLAPVADDVQPEASIYPDVVMSRVIHQQTSFGGRTAAQPLDTPASMSSETPAAGPFNNVVRATVRWTEISGDAK